MNDYSICHKPVDVSGSGFCREEAGWAKVRESGGTNALLKRKTTGRVAHLHCVKYGAMDELIPDRARTE